MTTVHLVVPTRVGDPRRPSGGDVYDRRVCLGLAANGWSVREYRALGRWPSPNENARIGLASLLRVLADDELVLIDGLVASAVPDVIVGEAGRLRFVVLLHMPLGEADPAARPSERAMLSAAVAVLTPSRWARRWLLDHYDLAPERVQVAEPGVDATASAPGSTGGTRLLSVGAVAPHKGHDLLVAALATLDDLAWSCQVAGALDVDPAFVDDVRRDAQRHGVADRLTLLGPLTNDELAAAYEHADVLIVTSRAETYGMVVAEAMAHGLPVIATSVGGVPEALGHDADGGRPGLLVPPGDTVALAAAIRAFLTDDELRRRLRRSVADRRQNLPSWSHTTAHVVHALVSATHAAGDPSTVSRRIP
jgi:glycosyltransferase involved in cell wall biosynthesis